MAIFSNICFTTIIVFIFKTSGYNVECDRLWVWSNKSLVKKCYNSDNSLQFVKKRRNKLEIGLWINLVWSQKPCFVWRNQSQVRISRIINRHTSLVHTTKMWWMHTVQIILKKVQKSENWDSSDSLSANHQFICLTWK